MGHIPSQIPLSDMIGKYVVRQPRNTIVGPFTPYPHAPILLLGVQNSFDVDSWAKWRKDLAHIFLREKLAPDGTAEGFIFLVVVGPHRRQDIAILINCLGDPEHHPVIHDTVLKLSPKVSHVCPPKCTSMFTFRATVVLHGFVREQISKHPGLYAAKLKKQGLRHLSES